MGVEVRNNRTVCFKLGCGFLGFGRGFAGCVGAVVVALGGVAESMAVWVHSDGGGLWRFLGGAFIEPRFGS